MACNVFKTDGGVTVIACGPRGRTPKCFYCPRPGTKLCDFVVGSQDAPGTTFKDGKRVPLTCDRRLCGQCARHTEPDTDVCRVHPVAPAAGVP